MAIRNTHIKFHWPTVMGTLKKFGEDAPAEAEAGAGAAAGRMLDTK